MPGLCPIELTVELTLKVMILVRKRRVLACQCVDMNLEVLNSFCQYFQRVANPFHLYFLPHH